MPAVDAQAAAIALTRFGLGARPGDIDAVAGDPRGWLMDQVRADGAPGPGPDLPTTRALVGRIGAYRAAGRERRAAEAAPGETAAQARFDQRRAARRGLTADRSAEFMARLTHGTTTDAGFAERWSLFWANLFTVSSTRFEAGVLAGAFEREAIRPHVFGAFQDLAVAAETHPAMLLYLDQARSVGPNSRRGRRRGAGLNENLAREILELHTVGAGGGYGQADVTEFARALTGWAFDPEAGGAVFRPAAHEPGARTVMGRAYAATPPQDRAGAQGEAILRDLARRPETAQRLSRRLAAHFVSDDPPSALVERLERAWLETDGDLAVVARALIEAPEAWAPQAAKFKSPYEWLVSTHRALDTPLQAFGPTRQALNAQGQPPFAPPSPEGWPDGAADWAGPDALVKRLDWARRTAARSTEAAPVTLAEAALGPRLGERTRQAVARAESRPEAVTLFLMSPEFQRR